MTETSPENDLVDRARVYATEAHQRINHRRKYNNEPYDVHLSAVAKTVASVSTDPEAIAAGTIRVLPRFISRKWTTCLMCSRMATRNCSSVPSAYMPGVWRCWVM